MEANKWPMTTDNNLLFTLKNTKYQGIESSVYFIYVKIRLTSRSSYFLSFRNFKYRDRYNIILPTFALDSYLIEIPH